MEVQLIPPWAPNVHPMVVHFPIVLAILAAAVEVAILLVPRARAWGAVPAWLYSLAAVSAIAAYASGRLAANTVFIPGMAHALIENHEAWATVTTIGLGGLAVARVSGRLFRIDGGRAGRLLFCALGITVAVLVQQTAERGARLVYEQGVGVVPGPVPLSSGGPEPAVGDSLGGR